MARYFATAFYVFASALGALPLSMCKTSWASPAGDGRSREGGQWSGAVEGREHQSLPGETVDCLSKNNVNSSVENNRCSDRWHILLGRKQWTNLFNMLSNAF